MAGEFTWNASSLLTGLNRLPQLVSKLIVATTEYQATTGEAYMKKNAKWTDRTSNARNSLHTETEHSNNFGGGSTHTIAFAHGMPYGIWLEVRFAGRLAIIMPSVQVTGKAVMETLNKGLARI